MGPSVTVQISGHELRHTRRITLFFYNSALLRTHPVGGKTSPQVSATPLIPHPIPKVGNFDGGRGLTE